MPNESYWQGRQEQKFLAGEKKVEEYYTGLEKAFEQAKREIQRTINDFVARYEIENGVTGGYAKAQKLLNKTELGELQDFIDMVRANMDDYNQDINNMSYKARITRYEALLQQVDATLQQLYSIDYQAKGEDILNGVYTDAYYQTWFNIDQYHGFHQEFAQVSAKTIEELIRYPFNGANFSTRLWKQKDHMLQQLTESITTMLIQGRNPMTLAGDFAKKFKTKEFEAYRLLHTEGSFMIEQGTLAGYKEDGVEKYNLLVTLDIKTSDICRAKDESESYLVSEAVVGVNYPPFHIFCRTTTTPKYEDSDNTKDFRVARDPVTGRSYEVPAGMKFEQWHKKFVEDNPKAVLVEKKWKNRHGDNKQYAQYKQKLGAENIPKTLDEFQEVKYTNETEYGILKAQVKGMTYYDKAVLNEPDITNQVNQVAESAGMDTLGLEYRIKTKESFLEKVRKNYNPEGNEYEIKDIVRYTLGSSADSLSEKTLKVIDKFEKEGYNTIRVKNTWNPDSSYNGINTFIKAPSGQIFEMQYHTPESFKLKNGELHKLYEQQRKISDYRSKEYIELEDRMIDLSGQLTFPKNIERVKNK